MSESEGAGASKAAANRCCGSQPKTYYGIAEHKGD